MIFSKYIRIIIRWSVLRRRQKKGYKLCFCFEMHKGILWFVLRRRRNFLEIQTLFSRYMRVYGGLFCAAGEFLEGYKGIRRVFLRRRRNFLGFKGFTYKKLWELTWGN